jgi:hypothetical protein
MVFKIGLIRHPSLDTNCGGCLVPLVVVIGFHLDNWMVKIEIEELPVLIQCP